MPYVGKYGLFARKRIVPTLFVYAASLLRFLGMEFIYIAKRIKKRKKNTQQYFTCWVYITLYIVGINQRDHSVYLLRSFGFRLKP